MSGLLRHKSIAISKPTHGHQASKDTGAIRTDHELVDRLQQWKHITKSLLYYHKGLADIEHASAKATSALTETILVPFHEGHVFSPDGWQQALYDVRDDTKSLASIHTHFAQTIESTVIRQLESVRTDIKQQITAVEKEASSIADEVEKEREHSKRELLELQSGIDTFENSSTQMLPQKDPYLAHHIVENQMKKQVHKENDLQSALIRFQQQQGAFEEGISRKIQSSVKLYEEARVSQLEEIEQLHKRIATALQRTTPDFEWQYYLNTTENHLIDPNTPLRSTEAINFPGLGHASTKAIKQGYLERKKRFSKSYKESYYVLTPSGYLHERRSSNSSDTTAPGFSLFLPECSLSPPAKANAKSHKFHIEGNKAVKSSFESKMKNTLRFGGKEIAYTFRARTHAEMIGWWETLDQLSRDTQAPTETTTRVSKDPIGSAIANIGYERPSSITSRTAESVASVPGTEIVEVTPEDHLRESLPSTGDQAAPGAQSAGYSTASVKSVQVAAPLHSEGDHVETLDSDSEEGGGSSEEEYDDDDELALARTAPSTPAAGLGHSNPLDSHNRAETLPVYTNGGEGSSSVVAEKAGALGDVKGNAPILGAPIASTSTSGVASSEHVETGNHHLGDAPATSAATTSAS